MDIDNDAACPVHPDMNHTWGECYSNPANKSKSKRKNTDLSSKTSDKKRQKTSASSGEHANVAADLTSAPLGDENDKAINDGTFSEDLESNGTFSLVCYADECEILHTSHHLDDLSFLASSQVKSSLSQPNHDVLLAYASFCEDLYSNGEYKSGNEITQNLDVTKSLRLRSVGLMTARHVQKHKCRRPFKVLFDTGSDKTLISQRALPIGANPKTIDARQVTGIHGTQKLNQEVLLTDIAFPEFSPTQRVPGPIQATVFNNADSPYDVIVGMDVMQALGIDVQCSTQTVSWNNNMIPFRPPNYFNDSALEETLSAIMPDDPLDVKEARQAGYKSKKIMHSNYEATTTEAVAQQQQHLTTSQQRDLANLLKDFPKLFSGKLRCFHRKIHLELKDGAVPQNCRPYPVPKHHEQVFKDELQRLVDVGALKKCGASEWLSPSFIVPKKDGRVRWISDFRMLNKYIKRRVYNLPKIQDILTKRNGYAFFTKLDISMQYYTFELDPASQELCTICTPYGNYRYQRLPMGVSQSPDLAQEIMEDLLRHLD